ncbi:MAG: hypothetical protein K2Y32_17215 [Candidatus Obscuribacterales bacterium]|nr:hypothetical protein [Candidatus Obscuribacterales bacterium]
MLCPHCNSPRHMLCADGFRHKVAVNVDFSIVGADADAASVLSALARGESNNLLGPGTSESNVGVSGLIKPVRKDESLLVVLPVYADIGLADFGRALFRTFLPASLVDTASGVTVRGADGLVFPGTFGSTMSIALPEQNGQRTTALLIGLGSRSDCERKGLCGLVGTSLDSALSGLYSHLVIDLADFTDTAVHGREIGSVSRCRLSLAILEDDAQLVLSEMSLLVKPNQVSALCEGIDVAGPLCSHCNHPRTGTIKLKRPEPHQD